MISNERMQQLHDLWGNETNEEWTTEWRDDLTSEEEALVDKWDQQLIEDMTRIVNALN